MQKIVPFLWFDGKAEEAMNFCVSVFKNAKAGREPRKSQAVMQAMLQMDKIDIAALRRAYGQG